jgi:hypothetical protein
MRLHLLTVESTERFGDHTCTIAPKVRLRDFGQDVPNLMMPNPGDEVELRLPDGSVKKARISSFGLEVWKDSEGNFYTDMDPSDPYLTLTSTSDSDIGEVPPGTEIWLPDARTASAAEDSAPEDA